MAWSDVSGNATARTGGAGNLNLSDSSPIAAGDTVICVGVSQTSGSIAMTVKDNAATPNVFNPDTFFVDAASGLTFAFFRLTYAAASAATAYSMTANPGAAGFWFRHFAGLNPAGVIQTAWLRQNAPGTGTGALTAGPITPSKQPGLMLGFSMDLTGGGGLPSIGSGNQNYGASFIMIPAGTNQARLQSKRYLGFGAISSVFTTAVGTDNFISGQLLLQETVLPNSYKTNPMALVYTTIDPVEVPKYGKKSGMIITGRTNGLDPSFAAQRAAGAEILRYYDVIERPDAALGGLDDASYMGNPALVPLWPFPTYGARVNFAGNHMTDIRVGSTWSNFVVQYVTSMMQGDQWDGVFLDVLGARLYSSLANWGLPNWTQAEMDAWTLGAIDIVRRLSAARASINPNFILVPNNTWDRGDTVGFAGEPYCDGVNLEHHPSTSLYQTNYAAKTTFATAHRRFLIITTATPGEAAAWAASQGVTNVSDQQHYTNSTDDPPIPFNAVTDRPPPNVISGGGGGGGGGTPGSPPNPLALTNLPGGHVTFPPKKQGETITLSFDFSASLAPTETISSQVVAALVYSGMDPNPTGLLSGTAIFSGTKVLQNVTGGLIGPIYELIATIVTSFGQTLQQSGLFIVKADVP